LAITAKQSIIFGYQMNRKLSGSKTLKSIKVILVQKLLLHLQENPLICLISKEGKTLLFFSRSLYKKKGNKDLIEKKVTIAPLAGLNLYLKILLLLMKAPIWIYLKSLPIKIQLPLNQAAKCQKLTC